MPKRTAKKSAKKTSARPAKKKAGKATKKATRKAAKKPAAKKPAAKKPASKKARKSSGASRSSTKAASGASRRGESRLMQLRQLIELMVDRDVVEVELEESGARWRVRRTEPQAVSFAAAPSMPVAAAPAMPATPASAAPAPAEAAPPAESEVYTSPMLGTFYHAPSPEAEAFVKVGDRVTADTTLCIIEAMKVMNEIKAEREFEVVEVLVKNGEPVEYGQPLFLIR